MVKELIPLTSALTFDFEKKFYGFICTTKKNRFNSRQTSSLGQISLRNCTSYSDRDRLSYTV